MTLFGIKIAAIFYDMPQINGKAALDRGATVTHL